jgi:O-acetyl-ADP-ribose deacetylase (regulator of RNase III)
LDKAVAIAVREARSFLQGDAAIKKIYLVCYSAEGCAAYRDALRTNQ